MAEEDVISTLPDAIICHILSFLETKHAVATTILSKRWKNLCRSVPVLHFYTTVTNQNAYLRFNDFVYSVLLYRDPALPIKSFYLDFTFNDHQPLNPHYLMDTITKWIKYVAQRGLQYLDLYLELDIHRFTQLPITILNCKTLVVLNLHCFAMEETFSPVDLPSLKTLDLSSISFLKIRDFMLFLTGCPILENLYAFDVMFDSVESLTCDCVQWETFCLTKLIRAELNCLSYHFPLKAVRSAASLLLKIGQVNCRDDFIPTLIRM